jgi:hypothetical protein
VLEVCEVEKVEPLIQKLFKRIVNCIEGIHLQVADRAMCFFENDYFLNILKTHREKTFPMLVPVIVELAETTGKNPAREYDRPQDDIERNRSICFRRGSQANYSRQEVLPNPSASRRPPCTLRKVDQVEQRTHGITEINNSIFGYMASRSDYHAPAVPFKENTLIRDFNQLYAKIYDKEKYVNL